MSDKDKEKELNEGKEPETGTPEENGDQKEEKETGKKSSRKKKEKKEDATDLQDALKEAPDLQNEKFVKAMGAFTGELDDEQKTKALALCLKFAGKTSKESIEDLEKRVKKHGAPKVTVQNLTKNKTWDFTRKEKIPTLVMLATSLAEKFLFELAE